MGADPGKTAARRGVDGFFRAALTGGRGRPAAAALLLLVGAVFAAFGADAWQPVRRDVFDAWQRHFPRQVSRFPVAIVDIDEESLAALGRWPWPRTRLAQLAEAVHRLGAEAVGFDIIMPEPDRLPPDRFVAGLAGGAPGQQGPRSNDELLADTLRGIPSVAARAALIDGAPPKDGAVDQTPAMIRGEVAVDRITAFRGHITNMDAIEDAAFGCGYLNDTRDPDGVVRAMPLVITVNGHLAPSLSVELLRTAVGANWYTLFGGPEGVEALQVGDLTVPTDPTGKIRLHFSPAYRGRRVSALSVLRGAVAPGAFDGQVAVIGVTAVGAIDVVSTPVAARMDGIEIQAQVVENILQGARLIRPAAGHWIELAAFLAGGALLIAALPLLHPTASVLCFGGFGAITAAAATALFLQERLLLDPSFPVAGNLLVFVFLLSAGFAAAKRRQRELDAALEIEKLERMRMAGELQAARQIQMGMLPAPGAIEGLPPRLDFFALLQPAEEVGGDLYDAFMIDDCRFFFLVGDVAGKGVAAALFMALTKTLCKSTVLLDRAPLGETIGKLNREMSRENPAMLFVTAVAGILDVAEGRLRICCAGHEAPVLIRDGQPPGMVTVAAGPPLCVLDDYAYPETTLSLGPGDLLLLISDGITEAQNPTRQLYGRRRILKWLGAENRTDRSAESVCRGVFTDVRRFADGADQSDDITVMAVGLRPGPTAG